MTARRCRPGTSCRSSPDRSAITSDEVRDSPVALPRVPRTFDDAKGNRIVDADQDNWNGRARAPGSERSRRPGSDQDRHIRADQFFDDGGQLVGSVLGPAVENNDVVAFGPAERGKTGAKRIEKAVVLLPRPRLDKPDARDLDLGRGRVPGHCNHAGQQQEIAAVHSITLSTRQDPRAECPGGLQIDDEFESFSAAGPSACRRELNHSPKGAECEAHHTSKSFFACRRSGSCGASLGDPGATGAVSTLRLLSRARTLTSPRGLPVPPASGDRVGSCSL